MDTIISPIYYQIVYYDNAKGEWIFESNDANSVFYKPQDIPLPTTDQLFKLYGLTKVQVMLEIFRLNRARTGYYLVNLKDKDVYYCGSWSNVRETFLELGVGRRSVH